jgi:DNA-directed RNA polymerase beta' subunit
MSSTRIHSVTISPVTNKQIENISVSCISTTSKTNDKLYIGTEDAIQGVYLYNQVCGTCGGDKDTCTTGHYSYANLKIPLINVGLAKIFCTLLSSFCHSCKKLRSYTSDEKNPYNNINKISKLSKQCEHCKTMPIFFFEDKKKNYTIYHRKEKKKGDRIYVSSMYLQNLFHSLDINDLQTIKEYNNFKDSFLYTNLMSLPSQYRIVSKTPRGSSSAESTKLLRDIINLDIKISPQDIMNNNEAFFLEHTKQQQELYYKGMYNKKAQNADNSIMKKVQGKKGIYRNNIAGKKINGVIRTVVSCDAEIPIDCISLPRKYVAGFNIQKYVTHENLDEMKFMLLEGKIKSIVQNGQTFVITDANRKDKQIYPGDTIYREFQDGDFVPVNRPPTIFTTSIICMRAILTDDNTCKINPNACILLNADYDGDALVIYIIIEQFVELQNAHVPNVILTNKQTASIGIFQNTCIELVDLIDQEKIPQSVAIKLLGHIVNIFTKEYYTGREIISMCIPEYVNIKADSSWSSEKLVIETGIVKSGYLDKKNSGQNAENSLFHKIALIDPKAALETNYKLQILGRNWSMLKAFTLSVKDFLYDSSLRKEVENTKKLKLAEYITSVNEIINGNITVPVGYRFEDFLIKTIMDKLRFQEDIGKMYKNATDKNTNNLLKTILSGARGKMENFYSLNGMIGLITNLGNLIPSTVYGDRNSLHNYNCNFSPDDMGLVGSSLVTGYQPNEFVNMAFDSLIAFLSNKQGAVNGGKHNSNLNKILEGALTDNTFATVFNTTTRIQQLYNNTGIDSNKLIKVKIESLYISDSEFIKEYGKELLELRNEIRYNIMINGGSILNTFCLPLNIKQEILDVVSNSTIDDSKYDKKEFKSTVESNLDELLKKIPRSYFNELRQIDTPEYMKYAVKLLCYIIKTELQYERMIDAGIGPKLFNILIGTLYQKFNLKLTRGVVPVGTKTAYSVCAPVTQHGLDSKHRAAGAAGNKTDPISKISEVINIKPVMETKIPTMYLYVDKNYKKDDSSIINELEEISFGEFIYKSYILWQDKDDEEIFPNETKYLSKPKSSIEKIYFKYVLNTDTMTKKQISLDEIVNALKTNDTSFYVHGYTIDGINYIRIYLRENTIASYRDKLFKRAKNVELLKLLDMIDRTHINGILVKGFLGIKKVFKTTKTYEEVNKKGEVVENTRTLLITEGYNQDVLFSDWVDRLESSIDSIPEQVEITGMHAGREHFAQSLANTIDLSPFDCLFIADVFTLTGRFTSDKVGDLVEREGENFHNLVTHSSTVKRLNDYSIARRTNKLDTFARNSVHGEDYKIGANAVILGLAS